MEPARSVAPAHTAAALAARSLRRPRCWSPGARASHTSALPSARLPLYSPTIRQEQPMVVTGILTLNPSVPLKMEKIEHEITKRTDGGSNLESYDGPELETSEAMRAQQFSLRPLRCPPVEGTRPASPL